MLQDTSYPFIAASPKMWKMSLTKLLEFIGKNYYFKYSYFPLQQIIKIIQMVSFSDNYQSIFVLFIFTGIILCVCGCMCIMCLCSVFIKRKWNTAKKYISYINMNLFFALLATKSKVCKGMTNPTIRVLNQIF